jgi:ATP-dependent DNA helicase RecQ
MLNSENKTQALHLLKKYYGYTAFRSVQENVIAAVLNKKDVMVLMPTGGGKSICFQLPALMQPGLCLVISPLIALMKDQVEGLKANGIEAEYLNSTITAEQEQDIIARALQGQVKLLYIAPEKLLTQLNGFVSALPINCIAIDEAHCISQWGHDFRPEYTKLGLLRERFKNVPVMALTATADKTTRRDIVKQLKLEEENIFISSFNRPNLSLKVRRGVSEKDKLHEIIQFIKTQPTASGIIYCLSRKATETMAADLKRNKINAAYYHAGVKNDLRAKVQEDFIADNIQVICATIAFGMGIDKADVRWVIHNNMPKNIESYYQEIGRAGRDGSPAETFLYYSYSDIALLTKFASESGQSELQLEKLRFMQKFCEARICRRKILLGYFSESLEENCNNCDVCNNPPKYIDATIATQMALSAIIRLKEEVGISLLILVLRGSKEIEILEKEYDKIKTYGAGKAISAAQWNYFILQMIQLGIIEVAYDDGFKLKISNYGKRILSLKLKVELASEEAANHKKETLAPIGRNVAADFTLVDKLKVLRNTIAKEMNVPAYVVFHDKTLTEISHELPTTLDELMEISGISQKKADQFGDRILAELDLFTHGNKKVTKSITNSLPLDDIKTYWNQLFRNGITPSVTMLANVLCGRKIIHEKQDIIYQLTMYGLFKNKIAYDEVKKHLSQTIEKVISEKRAQESITVDGQTNATVPKQPNITLNQEDVTKLAQEINALPILRPTDTIDNQYIIEQRKIFVRAYEPWTDEENTAAINAINSNFDDRIMEDIFKRPVATIKIQVQKLHLKIGLLD